MSEGQAGGVFLASLQLLEFSSSKNVPCFFLGFIFQFYGTSMLWDGRCSQLLVFDLKFLQ